MPASFTFPMNNLSGSESFFTLKSAAVSFYRSSNANASGLAGWTYGQGRVISLSTLLTDTELTSFPYQQLFINAVSWAAKRGQ